VHAYIDKLRHAYIVQKIPAISCLTGKARLTDLRTMANRASWRRNIQVSREKIVPMLLINFLGFTRLLFITALGQIEYVTKRLSSVCLFKLSVFLLVTGFAARKKFIYY